MPFQAILDTQFVASAMVQKPIYIGKVRETYDAGDGMHLVMIATDRVSAFDCVFKEPIPFKGEVLTRISKYWFDKTADLVENHLVSLDLKDFPEKFKGLKQMAGRAMLVKKTVPIKLECIVRGYLAGSAWKDYQKTGCVCGIKLPSGMRQSQKIETPIFTPSTKTDEGHDENVDENQAREIAGDEVFEQVRDYSIKIYSRAREDAAKKGIIIADTKFEFGILPNGKIILIDEALTPDSSRFWPADQYQEGISPPSFDKQYLRDWLENTGWNKMPPAPALSKEVIGKTSEKYIEAFEKITGEKFVSLSQ